MEKEAKALATGWLCDCGATYVQPQGNVKFPIRDRCNCGKVLYKIQAPDGIIDEFVSVEEWFTKEFDEQSRKLAEISNQCNKWASQLFTAQEKVMELREKYRDEENKMRNIVSQGSRRHKDRQGVKLSRRQECQWRFHRGMNKWIGSPKPKEKKNDTDKR
jgi:hypothetical protein